MISYSVIHDKNPREILLHRGIGCRYRKCAFCDYHTDRDVISEFKNYVMPCYINNNRVDILLNNTDFGIGGAE